MQIHELNNYSGNLDDAAFMVVDNGTDTGKISVPGLLADVNARIDNIIAGGDAPSEAEIIDARYGADGAAYASLGDAIRGQIAGLQGEITEIIPIIEDVKITQRTAWTAGKYIAPDSGNALNLGTYSCTDYMAVKPNTIYKLTRSSQVYGAFYTSAKVYISGINKGDPVADVTEITTPATAAYLRLSCPSADQSDLDFTINEKLALASDIYVEGVPEAMADVNKIVPNISEFDKLDGVSWTSGKYISPDSGQPLNNPSYSCSDFFKVSPSTEYVIQRKNNVYGSFYDENKNYLSQIKNEAQVSTSFTVTSPATAKYCRVSCQTSNLSYINMSINEEKKLAPNIIINEYAHIITVATDGSKDFTSLRSALESIANAAPDNKYLVEFYGDGTEYDATGDFTSTEIANQNKGLYVPDYVTLKGIGGKEKCIIAGRLTSLTTNRYFSVINLANSARLEGFTVIGDYTRNVLHQDWTLVTDVEGLVKDCELIGSNLFLAYVMASGLRSGCVFHYENVVFKNLTSGGYAFSCHNNDGFTDSGFLYFDNCRFIVDVGTTDFSVRLGSINTGANGINCNCILKGCKIPVQLRLNQENTSVYGAGILWKVMGYANDIAATGIYNTDGIDYSGNIDLI